MFLKMHKSQKKNYLSDVIILITPDKKNKMDKEKNTLYQDEIVGN